jgi:aryl-alcohol dehydrogenase-like predicted oxidoreductase
MLEPRPLGKTGISVAALGVGTNRWGADGKDASALGPLFSAALDAGANLIDTAEMYQSGKSEKVIGEMMRRDPRPAVIASKFAPYPQRISSKTLTRSLDATLSRLGARTIDLYLVHWPYTFIGIDAMMDRLADAVAAGKCAPSVSATSERGTCIAPRSGSPATIFSWRPTRSATACFSDVPNETACWQRAAIWTWR